MKILSVPAHVAQLDSVQAFLESALEPMEVPMRAMFQLQVAVEEIFVNIAFYAYAPGSGDAEISVERTEKGVRVTFSDRGVPFDPLARGEADISPDALENRIGGLGIHMVKKTMDEISYAYEDGQNVLSITKHF